MIVFQKPQLKVSVAKKSSTLSTVHASTSVYQISQRQPKRDRPEPEGKDRILPPYLPRTHPLFWPVKPGKGWNKG